MAEASASAKMLLTNVTSIEHVSKIIAYTNQVLFALKIF